MASSRGAVCAVALGGWLALTAGDAHAEIAATRLHLSYDVVPGCPTREAFLASLETRIRRSWVDGSDTRSFEVRVVRDPDRRFSGRLEIRQPGRPPSTREIRGESCRAVTTSLAVFIAIALDPASEPPASGDPPPQEERSEPRPVASGEVASQAHLPPPEPARHAPKPPLPPSEASPWIWSGGYAVSYLRAPEASWGGRVHAELAYAFEPDRLAAALRLSWGWSDFSTYPPLAGEARFRFKSARAEGCGQFGLTPLAATACAGVDVGALTAVASGVPGFIQATTPWTAAAGRLAVSWAIAPWLAFEVSGGLLVPFQRPRFALGEPIRSVYRAPAVLFEGSAGVNVIARF